MQLISLHNSGQADKSDNTMKKALALIPLYWQGGRAAPLKPSAKFEFGEKWPFTREEVMINCGTEMHLWVINPSTPDVVSAE